MSASRFFVAAQFGSSRPRQIIRARHRGLDLTLLPWGVHPLCATSGIDSGDTVAGATQAGVKHFLLKPYSAEALLHLMREVLDRPAAGAAR